MNGFFVAVVEAAACLGLGAGLLRVLGSITLSPVERMSWSFALGFGVLGWLLFFVGAFGGFREVLMWPLLLVSAVGCIFLFDQMWRIGAARPTRSEILILLALGAAFAFDVLEALSPPADADSMAYHFALPKDFATNGKLEFVPRAVDGGVPLLVQVTNVPAYLLGGEGGLTFWALVSGWGMVALAYAIARRFLSRSWSLTVALLIASTPAVIFGGGSGQVEPRLALFATLGAIALADAVRTRDQRYTMIAGLCAGFFMASKYTGVLFAVPCGVVLVGMMLMRHGPWASHGAILTITAVVAGAQWYVWNWIHTGDPLFPMLYGVLEYRDPSLWDAAHSEAFAAHHLPSEREVPVSLLWLMLYLFVATLDGYPVFESARTGLGIVPLLILPMVALSAWRFRARISQSDLLVLAAIAILFYISWFSSGVSQRIRHLLPIYPVVLITLLAAARKWSEAAEVRAPLIAAVVLGGAVQLGGHAVFTRNFAYHVLSGESRDAFLERNVGGYAAVRWVNENLGADDRVFVPMRFLIYLFEVPVHYAHPLLHAIVDTGASAVDPPRFVRQLHKQNITHLLLSTGGSTGPSPRLRQGLVSEGCLDLVKDFSVIRFESRTLPSLGYSKERWALYRLDEQNADGKACPS